MNLDTIKYDNDNLVGLEEQLTALKQSDGYLFKGEKAPVPSGFSPVVSNTKDNGSNNGSFKSYEQILSEIN